MKNNIKFLEVVELGETPLCFESTSITSPGRLRWATSVIMRNFNNTYTEEQSIKAEELYDGFITYLRTMATKFFSVIESESDSNRDMLDELEQYCDFYITELTSDWATETFDSIAQLEKLQEGEFNHVDFNDDYIYSSCYNPYYAEDIEGSFTNIREMFAEVIIDNIEDGCANEDYFTEDMVETFNDYINAMYKFIDNISE